MSKNLRQVIVSGLKATGGGTALLSGVRRLQNYFFEQFLSRNRKQRVLAWSRLSAPFAFATLEEQYVVRSDDQIIGKKLYVKGEFDFHKFVAVLRYLGLERVKTLYDIGANVGPICIPAVKRGYADCAVAFEPDPVNFALLDMNCRWNDVDRTISRHNCALGESDRVVGLLHPQTPNFGDIQVAASLEGPITAWMRRLCDFGFDFDENDLLWMDVQGHEIAVLAGASDAIRSGVSIVLELSPSRLPRSGSCERLQTLLSRYPAFVDLSAPERGWRPMGDLPDLWGSYLASEGLETDILVAAPD